MYYFTCIDSYSGVYQSQVIDVINYLNTLTGKKIKLIAFIPVQNFLKNRNKIKSNYSNTVVLPFFLGITNWRMNQLFLFFFNGKNTIVCRGPIASKLALKRFSKVVYDGRAAVKAEVEEYDVVGGNQKLGLDFIQAEKEAVLNSYFRIGVSQELIKYWENEFGYKGNDHVVIPCTLSTRTKIDIWQVKSEKIKIVYSGGVGPWQSFSKVVKLLEVCLNEQQNIEVLFLTQDNIIVQNLINLFPKRCERKWVNHNEVANELESGDYGILIRESNVTNLVASPVKFAEYLNAGLSVLISEQIGDFSEFVKQNNCGTIINDTIPILQKINLETKTKNKNLCEDNFMKKSPDIQKKYDTLIRAITVS